VLFDETFIHSAENKTDVTRIILFCDIERPLRTPWMRAINRWVSRNVIRASATQNVETEHVGAANRIYAALGRGSDLLTRLKRKNRTLFRTVKYALIAALVYWIFLHPLVAGA
jgi:beta-hydroxylase